MKITEKIRNIIEENRNDYRMQENGTLLLNPGKIPKCRHMIFKGLTADVLHEYLIAEYQEAFPDELSAFLTQYNGCNLYWVKLHTNDGISFAQSLLSVYGLPMTAPYSRPKDQDEPFDIRVEDLGRHENVSTHWLKFGSYIRDYDFDEMTELFIDTKEKKVFACHKNDDRIVDCWESLDECLCNLVDFFSGASLEYEVDI